MLSLFSALPKRFQIWHQAVSYVLLACSHQFFKILSTFWHRNLFKNHLVFSLFCPWKKPFLCVLTQREHDVGTNCPCRCKHVYTRNCQFTLCSQFQIGSLGILHNPWRAKRTRRNEICLFVWERMSLLCLSTFHWTELCVDTSRKG